ncbi:hypothetical protein LUS38_17520 [Escherichia coli]|uniref:hypothetical protein n=1 Tax=Escherichia coli TaxID=562 RepID=UPI001E49D552|nr:hypothetical protein [Escherichia coli]MCD9249008.1 hypothetical protein [Escherichia coli]
MPVTHNCFLDLARESLQHNGEQWTRNAISRSYYGMYHAALRVTNKLTPTHDTDGEKLPGGAHMRLYTAFCSGEAAEVNDVDVDKVRKIGVKLKMLHAQRVNADYKLERKINRITAISALQDAEEIDALVDQMMNDLDDSLIA